MVHPTHPKQKMLIFGLDDGPLGLQAMHKDCAKKIAHPDFDWAEDDAAR